MQRSQGKGPHPLCCPPEEVGPVDSSHSHLLDGGWPLCLQRVTSRAQKSPPVLQLLQLCPSEAASLIPLLPSEQLTEERQAALAPIPPTWGLWAQTAQRPTCPAWPGQW